MILDSYGLYQSIFFQLNISIQGGRDLRSIESASKILDIQFLRSGCNISKYPNISVIGDPTNVSLNLAISLPHLTEFDGFFLTINHEFRCDNIRFQLFGSDGNLTDWRVVGASAYRQRVTGVHFMEKNVPCNQTISIDYRPPWPLMCFGVLQSAFQTLLCFAICTCGVLNCARVGVLCFVACMFFLAVDTAAVAIGYVSLGIASESIVPFFQFMSYITIASVLCYAQEYFIEAATIWSFVIILVRIASDCAGNDDCENLLADFPSITCICAILGSVFVTARLVYVRSTVLAAQPGRMALDKRWAEASPAASVSPASLAHLHRLTSRLQAACTVGPPPRQCNRRRLELPSGSSRAGALGASDDSMPGRPGIMRVSSGSSVVSQSQHIGPLSLGEAPTTVPCDRDPERPVTSLAQLYAQAFAVAALLRQRCRVWAAASGGRVDPLFDSENAAADSEEHPGREIKDPGRAAEKALVRYDGDVSMLLDVCRSEGRGCSLC